jgi:protein-tyrosine phosphatase
MNGLPAEWQKRWLAPLNHRYGTWRGALRLSLAHAEVLSGRAASFTRPDLARVERLVFVCQGNICRSPFAEVKARALGLRAASLGLATNTGIPAFDMARTTAPLFQLSLAQHRATDWNDFAGLPGDLYLVMELRHAWRLAQQELPRNTQIALLGLWARPARPHIHDPHCLSAEYFRRCFATLDSAVTCLGADWRRTRGEKAVRSTEVEHA